uniref:Uncharacterized protein n=1 Tax=Paramormyrops kingsleyae TaxID=1676925 RepID=A0A3B3T559_9TELE
MPHFSTATSRRREPFTRTPHKRKLHAFTQGLPVLQKESRHTGQIAILFMVLSLALTLMRFIYRHNGIHNLEELRATENVIASRRGEFARQGVVDESKQEFFI